MNRLLELLKLGRIQFAGFLFAVMVSGALSLRGSALQAGDVAILLALALLATLWSFAHNDYCDAGIDRRSAELAGRPLVSGTVSMAFARAMMVCCILASLAITLACGQGLWSILVLLASVILGWLYNVLSKKLPGSDLLFAASTTLLCLLGALLVADGRETPAAAWNLVWTVLAIQFIDHVAFNAGATLKDVKNDGASSAVTAATFSGVTVGEDGALKIPKGFSGYIVLLRVLSLSVLFASPLWTGLWFTPLQLLLLAAAAAASLYLIVNAVKVAVFHREEIGRRWVRQEAMGKLLVPILLLETIGWRWALLLVAAPLGWFLLCNVALYGRGASLRKGF